MSMTAKKVLDRAEELGMLDPKVIEDLRRQVAESKFSVSAEAIVKVLVDKKHLTQFQAKKLVAEVTTEPKPTPAKRETGPAAKPSPPPAKHDDDDDLLLNFADTPVPSKSPPPTADDDEIVDLETALPPAQALKATVQPLTPAKPSAKKTGRPMPPPASDDGIVTLEPVDEATPASKGPAAPGLTPLTPTPPRPTAPPSVPGLTPIPGLTPMQPSAVPGLTPLQPSPVPGLTPMNPAPVPGLTPIAPAGPTAPGLTPISKPASEPKPAASQTPPGKPKAPAPIAPPPSTSASAPGLTPLSSAPAPSGPGLTPLAPSSFAHPSPLAPLGGGVDLLGGGLGGDSLGTLTPPPPPKEEKAAIKKRLARGWDSPILLLGGGGIGVILITGVVLFFALTRGSAQELLKEANEKYSAGNYATAISLYERFVSKYPDEPEVSSARVKIGAAQIHQHYDGAKDMSRALQTAEQVLPGIENEPAFDEVRAELESILPSIADNFATSARTATDLKRMEEQTALAHSAMKLVNNAAYLPSSRRKNQQARIDAILEKVRVAERTINQGKALSESMQRLQARLTAGEIHAAYQERASLLQNYPALESHPDVVKNTLAIAQSEQNLVTTTPQSQAAATDDPHLPTHRQLALARRTGDSTAAPANATAFLLIRGTVYAVDASTGKVGWRRHVGATHIHPLTAAGGDAIVADLPHRELLRLASDTGKVVWRQPLEEKFATPLAVGDHLFVTLESGRIVRLNAASGELDRAAQLPQHATVGPGADPRGKFVYQAAEHSTIFALAVDDAAGEPLACAATYYLGHPVGSIAVPPAVVVGYVFVFQNEGASSSLIHALSADKDGKLQPAREPIRLRGRVTVPPVSLRSRLIVVTDLGDALVADVDPGNSQSPVNITAQLSGGLSQPSIGYPMVSGSRLFIADTKLAEYEIQATRQDLDSKGNTYPGDAFVAPLQLLGNVLVHSRQRPGARSVTVTGTSLADGKAWHLVLSSPVASVSAVPEQRRFAAVSSDGDAYEFGVEQFKDGVVDQPTGSASVAEALSFANPVTLSDGRSLLWERGGKSWILQTPPASVRRVSLQAAAGDIVSARPSPFDGGILAPLSRGSIWLLDPATGDAFDGATPFQPETVPTAKVRWLTPVIVDERQFVAIDAARKTIYLARREEKPSPYLAQSRALDVDYEPAHAALLGKTLLVVARGPAEDELVALSLPALQETKRLPLGARLGPRGIDVVAENAFCEIGAGELLRISSSLEIAARAKFTDAPLAAPPLAMGSDWILVAQNGQVLRLPAEGAELQPVHHAGQPLTGAVQLMGSSLLAGAADGSLHVLPLSSGTR